MPLWVMMMPLSLPPGRSMLAQLRRLLRCEVVCLGEVLVDVVGFPLLLVGVEILPERLPRRKRQRSRHPAIAVDAAVDAQLEILRHAAALGLRVVKRVCEADPFDRLLLDTVEIGRGR